VLNLFILFKINHLTSARTNDCHLNEKKLDKINRALYNAHLSDVAGGTALDTGLLAKSVSVGGSLHID